MPTLRHRWKRQALQRFRSFLSKVHFPSLKHRYLSYFGKLRLKKPCIRHATKAVYWLKEIYARNFQYNKKSIYISSFVFTRAWDSNNITIKVQKQNNANAGICIDTRECHERITNSAKTIDSVKVGNPSDETVRVHSLKCPLDRALLHS
jgi:hypothetical protein